MFSSNSPLFAAPYSSFQQSTADSATNGYDNYNNYGQYAAQPNQHRIPQLVTLSWVISVYAREKRSLFKRIRERLGGYDYRDDSVRILNNVNGIVKPGQLCAIMGASGAGKTTLLNVLNFRGNKGFAIDGDIKVNGRVATLNEVAQYSGYVQQNDLFIATMTVREHLTFQAFLRMGRNYSTDEKRARVDEIINQVNLVKAENNYIGAGDRMKGISGGEKRRLSFASEILTNPSLLYCDEPTSGLDSYMAAGIVDILRDQARQGKTVVCTIHQPSTQIFDSFDTLCLLSEGRVAYFGPTKDAVAYFSRLGYVCPRTYNPADFYIQTLAILPAARQESLVKASALCDAYQSSPQQMAVFNSIATTNSAAAYAPAPVIEKRHYSTSIATQFRWLIWRNWISDSRTAAATSMMIAQGIFISLFFGLIYLQIDLDEVGVKNTNGLLFILMMNMSFVFLFPILNVFVVEMPIFYREHKNRLYSTLVFYLSKQIAEMPKYVIMSFIMCTIVYWMANVRNDASVFFQVVMTLVLSAQVGSSLGYFLSALSANINIGFAMGPPILIPLILFGGFFLNNSSTPDYFIWLKYISWFYYTFDAILIELWGSVGAIKCSAATVNGCTSSTCFANGQAVLNSFGVETSYLARDLILVAVIGLVLRVFGYVALRVRAAR